MLNYSTLFPYLSDQDFLLELDNDHNKEQYVKITILDFAENDIEEIQGRVTQGNITIDGNSNVRRTCSLTVILDERINNLTTTKNLLSINKKVRIELGFTNKSKNPKWKDFNIIWFPLGIYLIIFPNITHDINGLTVSLQLKDKMCLLNGEIGGIIPAATTFHEYETLDESGNIVISNPTIFQIIQELVNHFGCEQLGKIIINDIPQRIKQVMRWLGSSPIWIRKDWTNVLIDVEGPDKDHEDEYEKFEYGEDVGYILTDFTYPGELISSPGENVCTILDKIKTTLGNYEYFYDVYGNFVFQEIKNYLNTTKSTVDLNNLNANDYLLDMSKGKSVYQFNDGNLITSYSNTPQYNLIKNDFVVWGKKTSASGIELPIRYHLAIDKKPLIGNTYNVILYTDEDDGLLKAKVPIKYPNEQALPAQGEFGIIYKVGNTYKYWGYYQNEKNPNDKGYRYLDATGLQDFQIINHTTKDYRTELFLAGAVAEPLATTSNYYYTELENEWLKIYDLKDSIIKTELETHPSSLDFYLDFIDTDSSISELSVNNIGRRTIVENDDSINCVFAPDIPDVIFIETGQPDTNQLRYEAESQGYHVIQLETLIYHNLAIGGVLKSAYDKVRELLYQHTQYNENINISAIPIYYLDANTRITVNDSQSGITGDYVINSINIPLDVTSTMSIQATKALERF